MAGSMESSCYKSARRARRGRRGFYHRRRRLAEESQRVCGISWRSATKCSLRKASGRRKKRPSSLLNPMSPLRTSNGALSATKSPTERRASCAAEYLHGCWKSAKAHHRVAEYQYQRTATEQLNCRNSGDTEKKL